MVRLHGDALANVMEKAGYEVDREYYINDAGNQINLLAKSIEARYFQAVGHDVEMPEDSYRGKDIIELANDLYKEHGNHYVDVT